ncbi:hypothetical protein, partial [Acidocella sp.]|uniref:hypothetical protein n=1 Tax=Acidocella sp. TaxID=50710 RepID=UPI002634412A
MTALLLDRVRAAVAGRLDERLERYRDACGDAPPSGEALAAFDRLKDSAPMRRAYGEITKLNGHKYPVVYGGLRDDVRRADLVAELDRRDEACKAAGLPPMQDAERRHWLDKLPLIGGEEERIIWATVMLVDRAASLVLHPAPDDDRQDLIDEAAGLLEAQRKIRDFLLADNAIYDASVFEALDLTIIPALERNLAAKKAPIYAEIHSKYRTPLAHLKGSTVVLHKLVQVLFGPDTHLRSTIANILRAMTGENDISARDVESLIEGARRNVQKT